MLLFLSGYDHRACYSKRCHVDGTLQFVGLLSIMVNVCFLSEDGCHPCDITVFLCQKVISWDLTCCDNL